MKGLNLPKLRKFTMPCSVWKRALAFIIDLLIIDIVIASPFKSLLTGIFPENGGYSEVINIISSNTEKMNLLMNITIVITALALIYFVLLEWKLQQTIGKILLNVYIRSETNQVTFWQVLVSNISLVPFFPFVVLWIVDPIHIMLSPNHVRLMEKLVKIEVIEERYMPNA